MENYHTIPSVPVWQDLREDLQKVMTSAVIARSVTETCLVCGHREGVNIALLRWDATQKVELRRIEQFRSHVADNPWFGRRCAT